MKLPLSFLLYFAAALPVFSSQFDLPEITDAELDRLHDTLSVSSPDQNLRAHFSGLLDLEYYHFQQPAPALISSNSRSLFNPRLTFFLDLQLSPHWYAFAQARVDRGFDPSNRGAELRADEYALRFTPWDDARFNLQVGKFATVFGSWGPRHESWENPFVNAPLPYENLTPIWDSYTPGVGDTLLFWAHIHPLQRHESGVSQAEDKYMRLPIIWGPAYASGASVFGRVGKFDYAIEVKNTGVSARPEYWDVTSTGFQHPAYDAHFSYRPDEAWRLGVSVAAGPYLAEEAAPTLPHGFSRGDFHQFVIGEDISYAWHHFQFWAEFFETRFEVPEVGNADTFAYYLEAKYKLTPQLYGAFRWNQQLYGQIPLADGSEATWGRDTWRMDYALGYRLSAHSQLKLEYSLQRESKTEHPFTNLFEAQFTIRF